MSTVETRALAAVTAIKDLHSPIEWFEAEGDELPDLNKPLPPFCRECTDEEHVSAVEFGDVIDRDAAVVSWPCLTVQMIDAAMGGPR